MTDPRLVTATRAEDFVASPDTPQRTCLRGVREADVVVLVLGARYGAAQGSGLSATHEEYREAKDRSPVLIFIQTGVDLEPEQALKRPVTLETIKADG